MLNRFAYFCLLIFGLHTTKGDRLMLITFYRDDAISSITFSVCVVPFFVCGDPTPTCVSCVCCGTCE